jgi:hypothetical protein
MSLLAKADYNRSRLASLYYHKGIIGANEVCHTLSSVIER